MDFGQVFPLAPAALKTQWLTWLFTGLLVLMVGLYCFLAFMVKGAAEATITLRHRTLTVKGGLYGRDIPLVAVDVASARRLDDLAIDAKRPRRRTNGLGMPGLSAGWFRLDDGEKALVFLTDKSRAVYVPTSLGYALVLSPAEPDRFLDSLRRAAHPTP